MMQARTPLEIEQDSTIRELILHFKRIQGNLKKGKEKYISQFSNVN
jgi:hypothetical protein